MKLTLLILSCILTYLCTTVLSDRPRDFSEELVHYTHREEEKYVVISPLGIWTSINALAVGATNNSYNELARAFRLPKDRSTVGNKYKELTETVLNPSTIGITLTSSNFVFLDDDEDVNPQFKRAITSDFNATVLKLNLQDPKSANIVSNLIEKTEANIRSVIYLEDIDKSMMILANLISFKGLWSLPFNASNTREEPFYDESNQIKGRVNMMHETSEFQFSNIRSIKALALELPYGNDKKYSMLFLLPHPNVKVTDLYKNLAKVGIKDILKQLQQVSEEKIEVIIPRFKINTNLVINKPLKDMGVHDIFQPTLARFDEVSANKIFVSSIVHKAVIEVTEYGTAASATNEPLVVDKIPMETPRFHANKPFIYMLVEKTTMTTIFEGIYSEPTVF